MDFYHQISDWVVPLILSAAVVQLRSIANEIKAITNDLSVNKTMVKEHDKRLDRIEKRIYPDQGRERN